MDGKAWMGKGCRETGKTVFAGNEEETYGTSSRLKNLGKIWQFLQLLNNKIRNGREIGTRNGKRVPGNGKSGSEWEKKFPEREWKRPFFRFRSCLGATLTGHHVSPCEERVLG